MFSYMYVWVLRNYYIHGQELGGLFKVCLFTYAQTTVDLDFVERFTVLRSRQLA